MLVITIVDIIPVAAIVGAIIFFALMKEIKDPRDK